MRTQLDALDRYGELVPGQARYSSEVRAELLAMSAATIDRYLAPAKAKDKIGGVSTTKSGQWMPPSGHGCATVEQSVR
jgi:hypothetical protein